MIKKNKVLRDFLTALLTCTFKIPNMLVVSCLLVCFFVLGIFREVPVYLYLQKLPLPANSRLICINHLMSLFTLAPDLSFKYCTRPGRTKAKYGLRAVLYSNLHLSYRSI